LFSRFSVVLQLYCSQLHYCSPALLLF
jgi:hypothetical protein